MERDASLAYQTALAGGFDAKGKPLIRSVKDLFDREKIERQVDSGTGRRRVKEETIDKFKASKEHAEALLNGISVSTNEGEEDVDGE